MPVPADFKKTLAAFAERNSQTKTYTGEVITAPDVDGKCKVRVSGGTAQTCLANGLVEQGKTYPVVRFPGSPYLIVIGGASEGGTVAQEQSGLPLTLTSDLVAHALDGAFHTGTIRDDQAPQFATKEYTANALLDRARIIIDPVEPEDPTPGLIWIQPHL